MRCARKIQLRARSLFRKNEVDAEPEGILAGDDSARIFRRSRLAHTRYCSL